MPPRYRPFLHSSYSCIFARIKGGFKAALFYLSPFNPCFERGFFCKIKEKIKHSHDAHDNTVYDIWYLSQCYSLSGRDYHLDAPEPLERGDHAVARLAGLRVAPMPKARPVWPASAGQAADGPRLAEAWGSLGRALTLIEASGEPAGRACAALLSTECCTSAPLRQSGPWPR